MNRVKKSRIPIIPVLRKQHKYLENAEDDIIKLIHSYSRVDMKWMALQNFLRNRSINNYVNLIKQYNTIDNVRNVISSLNKFIIDSPKSSVPIKVYRGTGDFKIGEIGDTIVDWSFSGYSFKPHIASKFTNSHECCLYELNIPANSPFLFIGYISDIPTEYEILMPSGIEIKIVGERQQPIQIVDEIQQTIKNESYHIYECEFTGNMHIDDIFMKDPIMNLECDQITKAKFINRINMIVNGYRAALKYNPKLRPDTSREQISKIVQEFLNILSFDTIIDTYLKDNNVSSENKKLLNKIIESKDGGGKRNNTLKRRKTIRKKSYK
jgi:hypothetical protein